MSEPSTQRVDLLASAKEMYNDYLLNRFLYDTMKFCGELQIECLWKRDKESYLEGYSIDQKL